MAARGPTLGFDPMYVDFVISAWQERNFTPLSAEDLNHVAAQRGEAAFTHLTKIGLNEQYVKQSSIKAAIALLKALNLIKQSISKSAASRVVTMAVTPVGREILSEKPEVGNIRVGLIRLLVKGSPPLTSLLRSLDQHGPLSRPVASPLPGTPRRGAAFNRALLEGLVEFNAQQSMSSQNLGHSAGKQTASQALKKATGAATQRHPAGVLPSFDKTAALAAGLGLLWTDVEQVNEALGIESIGSAASAHDGGFAPNVPSWNDMAVRFQDALIRTYHKRATGSGLATVEALRGGIGRQLHISAAVVDAFLCLTREAGDRGVCPFTLQFEPNDELLYAKDRHPLIWHDTAFDFVEVRRRVQVLSNANRSSDRRQEG